MTSFAVQSTLGAVAPLVSKEKGSFGNRADCAGSHIKNNAVTTLQTAGTLGAAAGIGYGLDKSSKATNVVAAGVDKFAKFVGDKAKLYSLKPMTFEERKSASQGMKTATKFGPKKVYNGVIQKILGTNSKTKAAAVLSAITLMALGYITHKHSYKSGQIDQKYTDKAKFQQTL